MSVPPTFAVRNTRREDVPAVIDICRRVYTSISPYSPEQLISQQEVFPEGQFVAEETATGVVVAMAASLVVLWDDYASGDAWQDFTDGGFFTNHDPEHGRTLYGAEVMVRPDYQGKGVGTLIYRARRQLALRLGVARIRAGARLRGYHRYADRLSPREYVDQVVEGEIFDPTLSFQLRRGFRVFGVVSDYLQADPASRGYAALIEWINPETRR